MWSREGCYLPDPLVYLTCNPTCEAPDEVTSSKHRLFWPRVRLALVPDACTFDVDCKQSYSRWIGFVRVG